MQISHHVRFGARAGLAALVAATALGAGPVLISSASAAPGAGSVATVSSECSSAKSALAQAQKQQRVAKAKVASTKKALVKASKAKANKKAKVKKARAAYKKAQYRYQAATKTVKAKSKRSAYACSAPTSTPRAVAAGNALSLLALSQGLNTGSLDAAGLAVVLEKALPGITDNLNPAQLDALLEGFNAMSSGAVVLSDLAYKLGGAFAPTELLTLVSGNADPTLVNNLVSSTLSQLSGLGGGLPIPGSFDPTSLFTTFAGLFGGLSPAQLGSLVAVLSAVTGSGTPSLDVTQLSTLLDSLVPGLSDQFSPSDLTTMLAAVNAGAVSANSLYDLVGGRFSPTELTTLLSGAASSDLAGEFIALALAQLNSFGGGSFTIPTGLDPADFLGMVTTVTGLFTDLLSGDPLSGLCGIVPIPGLCP